MHRSYHRVKRVIFLAAAPVALVASSPSAHGQLPLSAYDLSHVTPIGSSITVLPLGSPPISGFVPQVVFGLTDEQDPNGDYLFSAVPSDTPGGSTLPAVNPHYAVATLDTGSDSHLIRYDEYGPGAFDLVGAGLDGTNTASITGAVGSEITDISDALGVYATGFGHAISNSGTLSVSPSNLVGQWNIPILSSRSSPKSELPNLIGSPMIAHHEAVITNSLTRRLNYNGTVYRSPDVQFQPLDTPESSSYVRFSNTYVLSGNGVAADPSYLPDVLQNNWSDNPYSPGFWAGLYTDITVARPGSSSKTDQFLFDTGADVSVISKATANAIGIKTGGSNPTPPDFYVPITGVGGSITQAPGFYLQTLSVQTSGGIITWTNVPVVMLDITDPRDFSGAVPGILGMNLFTDRDLIVNGGTNDPFVAFSEFPFTPKWSQASNGTWGTDTAWIGGVPDGADLSANFLSDNTSPRTITADANGQHQFRQLEQLHPQWPRPSHASDHRRAGFHPRHHGQPHD